MKSKRCPEYINLTETVTTDPTSEDFYFGGDSQGAQGNAQCDVEGEHEVHSAAFELKAVGGRRPNACYPTVLRIRW